MTKVRYHRRGRCLEVAGHAGGGEKGRDPVCAGVSTLTFALIAALNQARCGYKTVTGEAYVRLWWSGKGRGRLAAALDRRRFERIMDAYLPGYRLLAGSYPGRVELEYFHPSPLAKGENYKLQMTNDKWRCQRS